LEGLATASGTVVRRARLEQALADRHGRRALQVSVMLTSPKNNQTKQAKQQRDNQQATASSHPDSSSSEVGKGWLNYPR
jgi:hypothetical protein